MRTDHEKKLVG